MEKGIELLGNMAQCFGVQIRVFIEPLLDLTGFDGGLRSRLFQNYDTGRLAEFLRSMDYAVLYMADDTYNCHYCFLKYDGGGGGGGNYFFYVPLIEKVIT
jgi:hypothetical protein